ncbi:unnamed protein product [Nezara viridula]|uniref:Uncharacterized protein n=1 Tax=Nezara viridula TaxID=85310 RepID=A0A9P0HKZ1_NEZVI|nr:unnamed protein product [Nezara viridula]
MESLEACLSATAYYFPNYTPVIYIV